MAGRLRREFPPHIQVSQLMAVVYAQDLLTHDFPRQSPAELATKCRATMMSRKIGEEMGERRNKAIHITRINIAEK